jgi:predicted nucleic-acid-binding protein
MIAVDTNVMARWLLKDEPRQSPRALAVMKAPALFVSKTVLLELEWVMRGVYRLPPEAFADAVQQLLAMPTALLESRTEIEQALAGFTAGMDFADALHLAAAGACSEFKTFDARRFARRAARIGFKPPVTRP